MEESPQEERGSGTDRRKEERGVQARPENIFGFLPFPFSFFLPLFSSCFFYFLFWPYHFSSGDKGRRRREPHFDRRRPHGYAEDRRTGTGSRMYL